MKRDAREPGEFFWESVFDQALSQETERLIVEQRAAAEASPLDPRPYFHLGLLYNLQRKTEAAREMFERALAVDPEFSAAHQALGQLYAVRGDYRRAWEYAQEAAARGNPSLLEQLRRYPAITRPGGPEPSE